MKSDNFAPQPESTTNDQEKNDRATTEVTDLAYADDN